jgi:hypothetical protein
MVLPKSDSLYRPVALDRLSSPDALDQLMRVTLPQSWLVLVALAALFVVALLWALFGSIDVSVSGNGLLLGKTSSDAASIKYATIYVTAHDAAQIQPGMDAHITLQNAQNQGSAYLLGQVQWVSDQPASATETSVLGNPTNTILYAVQISLRPDATSPDGYQWSNGQSVDKTLLLHTAVTAQIVISHQRPISELLPGVN